ncbi:MAG: hypothetical protein NZM09_05230 [Ignavibacterium sp.]|nr:hypothetical protein [Ignavibacterium sp.]MCX7611145.1 hypothetical protein [Ignavibacterium sp.]MDW8375079.1 hypothetical protein [Ignavibacteriales bacterium]
MNYVNPKCKDVMQHICESLGEDLNSDKCIAIKNHLDNCSDCKNYFESIKITIQLYKNYKVDLPDEAHNKLMNLLNLNDCE